MSCYYRRSSFACSSRIVNPTRKDLLLWNRVLYLHILLGSCWIFAALRCMSFPWRLYWCNCWALGKSSSCLSGRLDTSYYPWFLLSSVVLLHPRDWPQWLAQSVRCKLETAILFAIASDQMCPVWLSGTERTQRGRWCGSTDLWPKKQPGKLWFLCSI